MNSIISSFLVKRKENERYLVPSSTTIGYIGWLGYHNLGDEAMYSAFKKMFLEFKVLPFKYNQRIKLYEKVMRKKFFDGVFLGGGTLINGNNYLVRFQLAQQKYKHSFVFGSGVRNPEYWSSLKSYKNCLQEWCTSLEKCEFVGVRGPLSKRILNDYGFCNSEVIGDPALFLVKDEIKKKKKEKRIGINIGVSDGNVYGGEKEVLNFIVGFTKTIINEGWKVTFLPAWNKDIKYIKEAARQINRQVDFFYDYESPTKVMNFLENCDLFIGEKLHSVILAMCVHTPAIMLGYRPKCLDFMMSMGLEEFHIRTDKLSIDLIINLMDKLYKNTEYYQENINLKATYYKQVQREKSDIVKKILNR